MVYTIDQYTHSVHVSHNGVTLLGIKIYTCEHVCIYMHPTSLEEEYRISNHEHIVRVISRVSSTNRQITTLSIHKISVLGMLMSSQ